MSEYKEINNFPFNTDTKKYYYVDDNNNIQLYVKEGDKYEQVQQRKQQKKSERVYQFFQIETNENEKKKFISYKKVQQLIKGKPEKQQSGKLVLYKYDNVQMKNKFLKSFENSEDLLKYLNTTKEEIVKSLI